MLENTIDFYPTPQPIIDKMLSMLTAVEFSGSILEPSAGKGDIALRLTKRHESSYRNYNRSERDGLDLDCIELDASLQHVLTGNKMRVIHDDFLTFETHKKYNAIVMNPPFSEGDLHLLKALSLMQRGGKVVCLLNAETLRNPYTNVRKDLLRRIDDLGATIEYIPNAFKAAERKSNVECALVTVDIPYIVAPSVILDDLNTARAATESRLQDDLMSADPITAMVERYNFEAKAGISIINEWQSVCPHILEKDDDKNYPILKLTLGRDDKATTNGYLRLLRKKYWNALFTDERFVGVLTSDVRKAYLDKVSELIGYEFTKFNIYTIRAQFGAQFAVSIDKSVADLFDELSHKHSWYDETSKNIHYFNGWKTNKAWKINGKVIITGAGVEKCKYSGKVSFGYPYDALKKLTDIEKVFSYLDGKPMHKSDTAEMVSATVRDGQISNIETPYFKVTFYLKGTTHITFTNPELLAKFNIVGSKSKNWLPPCYGKTAYKDMQPDEKAVVDSFQGADDYTKMLDRADYYLASPAKLLTGAMS